MVETWGQLEGGLLNGQEHYRYGYIGLDDHMMEPLLRPGSLVLVDPALQSARNSGWKNEYERPIYFVDVRDGYRGSWCSEEGAPLTVLPHPLSAGALEDLRGPD